MTILSARALRSAVLLLAAIVPTASTLHAQAPVAKASLVAPDADFGPRSVLAKQVPVWVSSASQVSRAVDLTDTRHLSIVLGRTPAVQAAFEKFLADQQTPGSPVYQQWLTPQQVGELYGPSASDLAAVTQWLLSEGLTVDSIAPSHAILEVSGSISQVGNAFRTSFGYFMLGDTARLSATSSPMVPTALLPVISGIAGLTDVPLEPQSHRGAPQTLQVPQSSANGTGLQPQLTQSSGTHYITPGDFATIYDSASVIAGGNSGATIGTKAQHIAIVGRARVPATSVSEYATNTGLPPAPITKSSAAQTPARLHRGQLQQLPHVWR